MTDIQAELRRVEAAIAHYEQLRRFRAEHDQPLSTDEMETVDEMIRSLRADLRELIAPPRKAGAR